MTRSGGGRRAGEERRDRKKKMCHVPASSVPSSVFLVCSLVRIEEEERNLNYILVLTLSRAVLPC